MFVLRILTANIQGKVFYKLFVKMKNIYTQMKNHSYPNHFPFLGL